MAPKRHQAEEITWKHRESEVLLSQGKSVSEACRQIGAADNRYYRRRKEYGVATADLNGDKQLDIVTVNYRDRSLSVLFGVGDGNFKRAVTIAAGLRNINGEWQSY